jgi:hypothetical protein
MTTPLVQTAVALAELVPAIARWFGKENVQTSGRIAAQVVDIAKKVTDKKEIVSALHLLETHPDLLLQFHKDIQQLDLEVGSAYLTDLKDARHRDSEFIKAASHNIRADIMVIAAVIGLVGCLSFLVYFHKSLPGEAIGIISTIAGIFGACLKDAYAFEFGSSRGSKEKDAALLALRRE